MKLASLVPLIAAICNFVIVIFVASRGLRSILSRVYFLWGIAITVWNLGTYFMFQVDDERDALFWARFLQFGVIFIPVTLFHLSLLIAQVSTRKFIRFLYAFHCCLALTNFTDFFIPRARYVGYAYYSVAGPGFYIFSLAYTLTIMSIFILARKRRNLPPLHRTRLTYLIIAQGTLVTFGTNDILPILGIDRYPVINSQIFPFGSAAAIFYGIIIGYCVLQHQLLDIRVTLGKAAAHLVRLSFLFLTGLLLLLVIAVLAPEDKFGPFAFFSALGVLLTSAVIASFFFPRLFGKGDDIIERRLLGDRFEYHDKVQGFIQSVHAYTSAGLLIDDLHDLLVGTVGVRHYSIILLDETTREFSLFRSHPDQPSSQLPHLHADSPLFRYFQKGKRDYLAFNNLYTVPDETPLERAAREQLRQFRPEFCFPLLVHNELFGLVLIGEKSSGELYTPHDVNLLTELVENLSLILNQIRLKKQVLLAEELELLGRMSRGMAHDLNNLLTPVSTFLQLLREELLDESKKEELLPVALRNIGTMQSYIREALFFTQHHTPRLEPARLDLVIRKAVETAEPKLNRKHVELVFNPSFETVVEIDAVLIQRLVANLLSNAIDASPPSSRITIELQQLARTEASRDWVRIKVIDEGEGISPVHLKKIFTPYFTTKDRGDETRGFGLGLSICRQIVHLHGGNLNIASQEEKGTTVLVDLPSHQVSRPAPAVEAYA